MDISNITDIITAFRAETQKNSVTPETVGAIMQGLAELLANAENATQIAENLKAAVLAEKLQREAADTRIDNKIKDTETNIIKLMSGKGTDANAHLYPCLDLGNVFSQDEVNAVLDEIYTAREIKYNGRMRLTRNGALIIVSQHVVNATQWRWAQCVMGMVTPAADGSSLLAANEFDIVARSTDYNGNAKPWHSIGGEQQFKTINGVPITGEGNIQVSTEGSIVIDGIVDPSSGNAVSGKGVATAIKATKEELTVNVLKQGVPFAQQVTTPDTTYIIKNDFNLGGAVVNIPEGVVLKFEGGNIANGTVDLSNCTIEGSKDIFDNIKGVEGWQTQDYVAKGYNGIFDLEWIKTYESQEGRLQQAIDLMGSGTIVCPNSLTAFDMSLVTLKRNVTIETYLKGQKQIISNGYASGSQDEIILRSPFHPAICLDSDLNLNSDVKSAAQEHEGRATLLFRRNGRGSFQIVDEQFLDEQSTAGKQWYGGLRVVRYNPTPQSSGGYQEMIHFDKNGNVRYGQLSVVPFYSPEYPHVFEKNVCIENESTTDATFIIRLKDISDNSVAQRFVTQLLQNGGVFMRGEKQIFYSINGKTRYGQLSSTDISEPSVPHEFYGNIKLKVDSGTAMFNILRDTSNYMQLRVYQDGHKSIEANTGILINFATGNTSFGSPIALSTVTPTVNKTIAFNNTYNKPVYLYDNVLRDMTGNPANAAKSGKFAQKPTGVDVGYAYFCTDKQTAEGQSNGIVIYHKGSDVWVDALGRTVN